MAQDLAAPGVDDRRQRRIDRLRKVSRLPSGKTWEPFEHDRMPLSLRQQLDQLAQGSFFDRGINVLAFGLPGTGKTHALCAWATAWWKPATPSSSPQPTVWCRACPCVGRGTPRRQARPRPAPATAPAGQL